MTADWDAVLAEMPSAEATAAAARCWCDADTSSIEMDSRLATAFAKRIDALLLRERESAKDARRILFIRDLMDGIGDIDFHEEATINASAFGRDEANDNDYIAAIRTAIDAAIAAEKNDSGQGEQT